MHPVSYIVDIWLLITWLMNLLAREPFYYHGLTLIPAWIINHMPSEVLYEITYPFPNFNGTNDEVWEWISNFISHYMMDVIYFTYWDSSYSMLVKGAPGIFRPQHRGNNSIVSKLINTTPQNQMPMCAITKEHPWECTVHFCNELVSKNWAKTLSLSQTNFNPGKNK